MYFSCTKNSALNAALSWHLISGPDEQNLQRGVPPAGNRPTGDLYAREGKQPHRFLTLRRKSTPFAPEECSLNTKHQEKERVQNQPGFRPVVFWRSKCRPGGLFLGNLQVGSECSPCGPGGTEPRISSKFGNVVGMTVRG